MAMANATADAIKVDGGQAVAIPVDVRHEDSIVDMVRAVLDSFGGVDILINNAGIAGGGVLRKPISPAGLRFLRPT
jgi:NAD(P)-dependent dehydrogenase (short-subunit alcohol dehydrogenase family)